MVEITEVRIYPTEGPGKLRGYANITIDNAYAVHGLRVLEGENGFWVSMPATRNKQGEFRDTFHPITKEAREVLMDAVLSKYNEVAQKGSGPQEEETEKKVEEELVQ